MAETIKIHNPHLNTLIGAGNDALSNLYRVELSGGLLTEGNKYNIRCESFDPPEFNPASTYQVRYINAYIDRPVASTNVVRNFSMTFRVDTNYSIYKEFMAVRDTLFKPSESKTLTDMETLKENSMLVNLYVVGSQEDESDMLLCTYRHCWITSITPPSFTTGDSKPATMTVKFAFLEMEDMFTINQANASKGKDEGKQQKPADVPATGSTPAE